MGVLLLIMSLECGFYHGAWVRKPVGKPPIRGLVEVVVVISQMIENNNGIIIKNEVSFKYFGTIKWSFS